MELTRQEFDLLVALEDGLPLTARPYQALGEGVGLDETETIETLRRLIDRGVIRRFGLVVRHHELGYKANAMVVWDVPDTRVAAVAAGLAEEPLVTLCYRRPRRGADWPYNLFSMVHGQRREQVTAQVQDIARRLDLGGIPREILFSRKRFKQRGARYAVRPPVEATP